MLSLQGENTKHSSINSVYGGTLAELALGERHGKVLLWTLQPHYPLPITHARTAHHLLGYFNQCRQLAIQVLNAVKNWFSRLTGTLAMFICGIKYTCMQAVCAATWRMGVLTRWSCCSWSSGTAVYYTSSPQHPSIGVDHNCKYLHLSQPELGERWNTEKKDNLLKLILNVYFAYVEPSWYLFDYAWICINLREARALSLEALHHTRLYFVFIERRK